MEQDKYTDEELVQNWLQSREEPRTPPEPIRDRTHEPALEERPAVHESSTQRQVVSDDLNSVPPSNSVDDPKPLAPTVGYKTTIILTLLTVIILKLLKELF